VTAESVKEGGTAKNMGNRNRRNKTRETFFSRSSVKSYARELGSAKQKAVDNTAQGGRWESGFALSPTQPEAFIPWAMHAVERAFSRALHGEAEHYSNQKKS
jgi:hypothetical protein